MKLPLSLLTCTLILLGCAVLIVLAGTVNAQTQTAATSPADWRRYTVKGEEFSVTLPTLPALASNKAFSAVVPKWRMEKVLVTSADGVGYLVYACDNSKQHQSLKDFIADQAAKFDLDLTNERPLNVNGFPGTEFTGRD